MVSQVTIPGTVSGFTARQAWVYLPPAYLDSPRPKLPVLMLLPGQPGGPINWMQGGHLVATMDAFAALHHGVAPITVMPDATGSTLGNTMCLNTPLGNADTYLTTDVPAWVAGHLEVDRDTAHWAVGGFSFGGTCALQLAVAHPTLFPTFLDISGQVEPTLGSTDRTISQAFGGSEKAYRAAMPLSVLAADQADPARAPALHQMVAIFAAGTHDGRCGLRQPPRRRRPRCWTCSRPAAGPDRGDW